MEPSFSAEQALLADVAALRERFTNTQELYREVCAVMFFRYGFTPTANKLYQYVKKGSMSAPSEALAKFWGDLREKSRVRIEHPDLPDQIKSLAGELAASLWDQAQARARELLASHQAEARAAVVEAKAKQSKAEDERGRLLDEADQLRAELGGVRKQVQTLQQQCAADAATKQMQNEQLFKAQEDIAARRQAEESARQYFSAEIEKLRSEAQLAEERFRATEKRALLEIDRERSANAKLGQELTAARVEAARRTEQQRLEVLELQQQLGDIRQFAGGLEGKLQAAGTQVEQRTQEVQNVQKKLAEIAMRAAVAETTRDHFRLQAELAQKKIEDLTAQLSKRRSSRTRPS